MEGAEGAIGLEGAKLLERAVAGALGAGLIAAETVEEPDGLGAHEVLGISGADFGFDRSEAVEIPGGVEDLLGFAVAAWPARSAMVAWAIEAHGNVVA